MAIKKKSTKRNASSKKKAPKRNCKVSTVCNIHGRGLQRGLSISASEMNRVCKPEKKERIKKGCLNGTSKSKQAAMQKEIMQVIKKYS